jgi:hypothetical protein
VGGSHRPILKYFKGRKRNKFFPEVVVVTVSITLKNSHGQIIITSTTYARNVFQETLECVRMTTND